MTWITTMVCLISHLDPDILECEVKWALEHMTMNKASGGDGIPAELFQILNRLSGSQQTIENSQREYQTTLPASWETCMQVRNHSQNRHRTMDWFKIGKGVQGWILSPCLLYTVTCHSCHSVYPVYSHMSLIYKWVINVIAFQIRWILKNIFHSLTSRIWNSFLQFWFIFSWQ